MDPGFSSLCPPHLLLETNCKHGHCSRETRRCTGQDLFALPAELEPCKRWSGWQGRGAFGNTAWYHVELSSSLRLVKAVGSDFKEKRDWFFTKQCKLCDTLLLWIVRPVEYPSGKFDGSFCLLGMFLLTELWNSTEIQKSMLLLNNSMHCIKLLT